MTSASIQSVAVVPLCHPRCRRAMREPSWSRAAGADGLHHGAQPQLVQRLLGPETGFPDPNGICSPVITLPLPSATAPDARLQLRALRRPGCGCIAPAAVSDFIGGTCPRFFCRAPCFDVVDDLAPSPGDQTGVASGRITDVLTSAWPLTTTRQTSFARVARGHGFLQGGGVMATPHPHSST